MGLEFGMTVSSFVAIFFVLFMIVLFFLKEDGLHYFLFGPFSLYFVWRDFRYPEEEIMGITT